MSYKLLCEISDGCFLLFNEFDDLILCYEHKPFKQS